MHVPGYHSVLPVHLPLIDRLNLQRPKGMFNLTSSNPNVEARRAAVQNRAII